MKVALVSTHPPRQCGIATYTRKLSAALVDDGDGIRPEILCERGGEQVSADIPCEACFSRGEELGSPISEAAARRGIDLAHFQHAPDIFGVGRPMLAALELLHRREIAVAVTLHTVFTRVSGLVERHPFAASFHRALGQVVDGIVVHSDTSRRILEAHGVPVDRIELIPHGTDNPLRGDASAGRRILGIENNPRVLLFFGFIHMQKNVHVLLKALAHVVRSAPDTVLAIVGKPGGDSWYNRLYTRWLKRLARRLGLTDNVAIVDRFVTDEEAVDIHAAATAVLLPHAQGYGSASGVVHNAMSMGLPLICSDSIKFEEVAENISSDLQVPTHDVRAWAEKISRLLDDDAWRDKITSRVESYARDTRWSEVARQHAAFYHKLGPARVGANGGLR
ncbi:MAG: glycosyltransferase [Deltaproteobacteria bacterium]|nr:glycosyltransferase [Deltaproteobacteria bacterium]